MSKYTLGFIEEMGKIKGNEGCFYASVAFISGCSVSVVSIVKLSAGRACVFTSGHKLTCIYATFPMCKTVVRVNVKV